MAILKPPKNAASIELLRQHAVLSLLKPGVMEEVVRVRKLWGIPRVGFKNWKDFLNWIQQYELNESRNDRFKKLLSSLRGFVHIKTDPKQFLLRVLTSLENKEYPDSLFFLGDEDEFHSYIQDRPFPGVVHYILFGTLPTFDAKEIQMSFDKNQYILLRIGPNATRRDFDSFHEMIVGLQKSMPGYNKNKRRAIRNFDKKVEAYKRNLSDGEFAEMINGVDDSVEGLYTEVKRMAAARQLKRRMKNKLK